MSQEDRVVVESNRFGRIEAERSEWIEFPGLPGFPDARRFVLRGHDTSALFAWLVSLDIPELAFAVTNPWDFIPSYEPPLEARHLRALGVETSDDLEFLVVLSVHDDEPTLNLAAPLVFNARTRRGLQAILERGDYSAREPLPKPEEERAAEIAATQEDRAAKSSA